MVPAAAGAQGLTGALIGTVKDEQGGVLPGARVRLSSPALIGGPLHGHDEREGPAAFPALASRTVRARHRAAPGFAPYHEENIRIGAGATIERTAVLKLAGVAESIVVEGPARGSKRGAADSRRASARRTCATSRRGGPACST